MVSCGCSIDGRVQVGNRVRSTATFTNAVDDYNPIDPNTVTADVTDPSGNLVAGLSIVNDGIGIYYTEFDLTEGGKWTVKWTGTSEGPELNAVTEVQFRALNVVT